MNENYDFRFDIAVLGEMNVGKKSIIEQFAQYPGYNESSTTIVEVTGVKVILNFLKQTSDSILLDRKFDFFFVHYHCCFSIYYPNNITHRFLFVHCLRLKPFTYTPPFFLYY